MENEYGIKWVEFDRKSRMVTKEKFFNSRKAMDTFIRNLEKKNTFLQIKAVCCDGYSTF